MPQVKVRLRSNGKNDTWLELDGKRLDLPITSVEFEHKGGNPPTLPTVKIGLELVGADALATVSEETVNAAREFLERIGRE